MRIMYYKLIGEKDLPVEEAKKLFYEIPTEVKVPTWAIAGLGILVLLLLMRR